MANRMLATGTAAVLALGVAGAQSPKALGFGVGFSPEGIGHLVDTTGQGTLSVPTTLEAFDNAEIGTISRVLLTADGNPVVDAPMMSLVVDTQSPDTLTEVEIVPDRPLSLPLTGLWTGNLIVKKAGINCQPGQTAIAVHGEVHWNAVYGPDQIIFDQQVPCGIVPTPPKPLPTEPPVVEEPPQLLDQCASQTASAKVSDSIAGEKKGKAIITRSGKIYTLKLTNTGTLAIRGLGNGASVKENDRKKNDRVEVKIPRTLKAVVATADTKKKSGGAMYNVRTGVLSIDVPDQTEAGKTFAKRVKLVPRNPSTKSVAINTAAFRVGLPNILRAANDACELPVAMQLS